MNEGMTTGNNRILKGVRVLDLTRFLSGPQATLFLAGMGAEIIRVDDPATGDPAANAPPFFGSGGVSLKRQSKADIGIAYLKRARSKKSITLNLKSEEGRRIFYSLVRKADVVVENFRVGVTKRLGIDYPVLERLNPKLIYCSITGYGSTGPDRNRKAFDLMVQAATGLMSITGDPQGEAYKTGSPLSDGIAGTFAVNGILGALIQRDRLGVGQFIDVSMADCMVSLLFDEPLDCYNHLNQPMRQGNRIMRFSPCNTYPANDGKVAIGIATPRDWIALLEVMERTDLLQSKNYMDVGWRIANNAKVDSILAEWTACLSCEEIIEQLDAREISCSQIRSIEDVLTWPHLRERGMLNVLQHPEFPDTNGPLAPAFPLKFSRANTEYTHAAVLSGQHNEEIYGKLLGLSNAELERLASAGVI